MNKQINVVLSIIVFATLTRVAIPPFFGHLPNFSALDALALFCGAFCSRRSSAIALAVVSVWLGDLLITKSFTGQWTMFYEGCFWQYGCYALITLLGSRTQRTCTGYIVPLMALTSAVLYFVISNFGVWFSGILYPQTLDGLIACYVAAIPFFKNSLVSDLVFSGVLFGAMQLQKSRAILKRRQT